VFVFVINIPAIKVSPQKAGKIHIKLLSIFKKQSIIERFILSLFHFIQSAAV